MNKLIQFLNRYKAEIYYILFFISIGFIFTFFGISASTKKNFPFVLGYFCAFVVMILTVFGLAKLNHRFLFLKLYKIELIKFKLGYWTIWIFLTGLFVIFFKIINSEPGLSIFITFFINVFTFLIDYIAVQKKQKELINEKTEAELIALKAQVNPHFLFNALNTIYNEASKEGNEHSAELIQQLSSIMRFTLQESSNQFTKIDKEITFVEMYVALQKARLPIRDDLKIEFSTDWDGLPYEIAPLMLIPFIENAFQYAVSFEKQSFIICDLTINDYELNFTIENSIAPNANTKKGTGSGIDNVKKRLELIYPEKHSLTIRNENEIFKVELFLSLTKH